MSFDMKTGRKRIAVKRLIELLGKLPPDALVEVNAVANLVATNADDDMIGFVDFHSETVVVEL